MNSLEYRLRYHRTLPHIQPKGATFFVTFRLHGSIPQDIIQSLQEKKFQIDEDLLMVPDETERTYQRYVEQKRHFGRYERYLDNPTDGPMWLSDHQIAKLIVDGLHYRDNRVYILDAFCIMSNHVHVVFTPLQKEDGSYHSLPGIMQSLKRYTSIRANQILNRTGKPFWQSESYDHAVRGPDEWHRIVMYVLNNPVKAGLIDNWEAWPWSYCKHL